MIKIFALSVMLIFFFSGCGSVQIKTVLVPEPFPICEELEIYPLVDTKLINKVRPFDLAYLNARKKERTQIINSYEKEIKAHNEYCKKIKKQYQKKDK